MMSAPLAEARGAGLRINAIDRRTHPNQGGLHPFLFHQITPATWSNHAPLETVADRSAPVACGPHVDQVN